MQENDLSIVLELAMLANPHVTKEKYGKHVSGVLSENPDLSFVATDNGKVVGYVQAEVHDDRAMLEDIAVARKYQSKGIGKRLLDRVLKTLERKKAKSVLAEVHWKCASAIPFYYEHGFRIIGFVQDYFGNGHDAMILKLALQQSR